MTLRITLTQDNGNTREVLYTVPQPGGHALYSRLVAEAFEVCYGADMTPRALAEGNDALSREASHYTPEV